MSGRRSLVRGTMLLGLACLGLLASAGDVRAQLIAATTYRVEIASTETGLLPAAKVWLLNDAGKASAAAEVREGTAIASITVDGSFGRVAKVAIWTARDGTFAARVDAGRGGVVFGPGPAGPVGPAWLKSSSYEPFAGCCSDCSNPDHCTGCHEKTWLESIFGCVPGTIAADCPVSSNGTYTCHKDD